MAVYSHPEFYPPTLNAMTLLAERGYTITILCNNVLNSEWRYPNSVRIIELGDRFSIRDFEEQSVFWKVRRWLRFIRFMHKHSKAQDLVLLYDPIPLASYYLATLFGRRFGQKIWYHNHDVHVIENTSPFSITGLAVRLERAMFKRLDVFSLPAEERKEFFPLSNLKGAYFRLPNYPMWSSFKSLPVQTKNENKIRLLFQGSIGTGHGIEEICEMLPFKVNGKEVHLVLKGFIRQQFKSLLEHVIAMNGCTHRVHFVGPSSYQEVRETTIKCDIGIAIFTKNDVMNRTLGTASNKIYEYAACGLPIIYYNNAHFNKYLGVYDWAIPVSLEPDSIINAIEFIDTNYSRLSRSALKSVEDELNFESEFEPIHIHLQNLLEI